jgi:hypothetical protein
LRVAIAFATDADAGEADFINCCTAWARTNAATRPVADTNRCRRLYESTSIRSLSHSKLL